jgi:hypothetical protein
VKFFCGENLTFAKRKKNPKQHGQGNFWKISRKIGIFLGRSL